MHEKEFVMYLDEAQENRYRHQHVWDGKRIVAFRIQYEAWIDGQWHPIIRYDTAHGFPHRDRLHANGTQTKEEFPHYSYAEVLTLGQRDIIEYWLVYRAEYEKELST